jgi:hypothetical protein
MKLQKRKLKRGRIKEAATNSKRKYKSNKRARELYRGSALLKCQRVHR